MVSALILNQLNFNQAKTEIKLNYLPSKFGKSQEVYNTTL